MVDLLGIGIGAVIGWFAHMYYAPEDKEDKNFVYSENGNKLRKETYNKLTKEQQKEFMEDGYY